MEYFLFLLNILLITAFATSIASAYYLYHVRGGRVFIALGLLFLLYFIDNAVVFMTEQIPSFALIYDSLFINSPVAKAFLHIGITSCYFFIHKQILREKFNSVDYVLLIIYAMTLFTVQLISDNAWSSWAFYAPTTVFCGGLAVYGLARMKRYPRNYRRTFYKFYKRLAVSAVIMSLMILLEDTYVIFNIDIYTDSAPNIFNRNFSENLMVFLFSLNLISYTRFVLINREMSVFGSATMPPGNMISTMDAFCHIHSLTDREREVLSELITGLSALEISEKLYISGGTVKTHIHNIYRKVDVGRKNELIRKYTDFELEASRGETQSSK